MRRLLEITRVVAWHRRLLAAALAAISVALMIDAIEPTPKPTVAVLAASRDLPGGFALDESAITQVQLPAEVVPTGALEPADDVTGRVLAGPVRAGEPLTDVRLVGPSLLAPSAGDLVAAPVRIADAEVALLLRPGDRIDVLAAPLDPLAVPDLRLQQAAAVARNVPVLAVPASGDESGLVDGALVLVATTPEVARRLAGAAVSSRLSVTLRAG